MLDDATISKMKVAELKQELEDRQVEIPKGAKKADLVALLRKAIDSSPSNEDGNSNDVSAVIAKISAEDDLTKELNDDDDDEDDEEDTKMEELSAVAEPPTANGKEKIEDDGLDIHAGGMEDLHSDSKSGDDGKEAKVDAKAEPADDTDPPEPKEATDVRGESPELQPPPVKKRRESPSHDSNRSSHRSSEPRRRNPKSSGPPEKMDSDTKWDDSRVQISPYMCDLNLKITDANRAENINYEGLGYCYGGAKATHGVRGGKVCFELHISRELPTRHLHADEKSIYWCRVGWSTGMSDINLGEDEASIGFDSHAKLAHRKQFMEFGSTFKRGDTIGCFLDLTDPQKITVAFTRNGKQQLTDEGDELVTFERSELGCVDQSAFYPHFQVKNYSVHLHFGRRNSSSSDMWESAPKALRDYKLIGSVSSEERIAGPVESEDKRNCTVIMMCGLPSSGKTTWVENHMNENRAKHFHLIGNEAIMDKMAICGEKREKFNNKHGTPFEVLQSTTMGAVLRIMERAVRKKRNYILDQANIYKNGHIKKMGPFQGFHRRAVVVVPSEEEYEKRKEKKQKEGGRKITYDNNMKWKAAMSLPDEDEGLFEKIDWLDLAKEEATELVAKYNEEGEAYKKKMEEKYGTSDRNGRYNVRRPDTRRSNETTYSNPPPVVYSQGGTARPADSSSAAPGAPGAAPAAGGDQHAAQWQEYYKKYFEYYGQYPQSMPPPVVHQTYNSGSGQDTANQWAQYQQQYQQYYQQCQQYYAAQQPPPSS